jgi:hypothetical protein
MLSIALIHHFEKDRLDYLRPKLKLFEPVIDGRYFEVTAQQFGSVNFFDPILRKLKSYYVARKRSRIDELAPISAWNEFRDFRFFLRSYLLQTTFRDSAKRNLQIEDVLTRKHIEALSRFLLTSGPSDRLIVLESDALIQDDQYFMDVLSLLPYFPKGFIVLGAHYHDFELGLKSSEFKVEANPKLKVLQYNRCTSNTTVAYSIDYELASLLLEEDSNLRTKFKLTADYWFNALFTRISVRNKQILAGSFYFAPSPILNGSLLGDYNSSFEKGF